MRGGAFGKGLDENIQDAYRFLVHNYAPGDEIFLFGFSRGAYTVRGLAGPINNCSLLKREHADKIPEAYKIYRSEDKPNVPEAKNLRRRYSKEATIKFLGVWDTVGARGIPIGLFKGFNEKKYSFHDTTLSHSLIQNAYHALAIDEKRKPFEPTIWKPKKKRKKTEQVWFAGVHSEAGGGYPETGLSDIALDWMLQKARGSGLAFNNTYLSRIIQKNPQGKPHNSYTFKSKFPGKYVRPIGASTDESLHASVRQRHQKKKSYRPQNLLKYMMR